MRPRILFVTSHWPHGQTYGAQQRALNICRLLQRMGSVSVVVASADDADAESLRQTRREFHLLDVMRLEPHTISMRERLRCELDPAFMRTHYQIVSPRARASMLQAVAAHDVVWVFGLHEANAFGIYRWAHSILDIDDVQSRVYAAMARTEANMYRKLRDYRMSLIWRRRERLMTDRFDVLAVCSDDDRAYLGAGSTVQVIPNGFVTPVTAPSRTPATPPRFGFIGLCEYGPNRDGVQWFIRSVWPLVKREMPDARLCLIGRGTETAFSAPRVDIHGLGYVDDPAQEIATWTAMIVPIRFGGGTRVKIAEAFSRRCPIVSTSAGAAGYDAGADTMIVADEARAFADACVRVARDRPLAERLAENGWRQFTTRWTWSAIEHAVADAVRLCAEQTDARGAA